MVVTTPAANCNPDDRMVGDPSPCADPAATAAPNASPNPNSNPDADIVASVPSRPGELPEGTVIRIALGQDLSSSESLPGSDFTGKIAADVLSEGKVVIPQGAEVLGKIVRVAEGRRFGAPATIRLRPDVVVLPDGSRYVLRAQVIAAGAKARVDDEGALQPASRIKANALKEGVGIGAGAVAGALVAGAPGALVGSLVGAGVMTTHILVQHPAAVRIPQGSTLTLSLTQPMAITPEIASN
jgi:type IV secretory pathway VirB10-like protein